MKKLFGKLMIAAGTVLALASLSFIAPEGSKTASFNTAFELKIDEEVFLPKARKELSVSLLNLSDNRCPENVQCITEGKASVEIKLTTKEGVETTTKLALEQSENASDTTSVTLDETTYLIVLKEVDRLFANKVTMIVKKSST